MQREGTVGSIIGIKGLRSFSDRINEERDFRLKAADGSLDFGVSFLDDSLGGMFKSDLVVIGAATGQGKSQLATLIALRNAEKGRRIHMLALEAEEYEIERRIKYQLLSDHFYKMDPRDRPKVKLSYQDWYYGRLDKEIIEIESLACGFGEMFPTLKIFYRDRDFGIKDFERIALSQKDETDLIIVDHLHYFDTDDENENKAVKEIVKKIRDCALITGKPVILVSHVRKRDRRVKQIVPEIEDFHGSSDIGKIATKAIAIAPSFERNESGKRETYFSILKNRVDGARTRQVALMSFDLETHRYADEYYLGRLNPAGDEFLPYNSDQIPFWAKKNAKPAVMMGEP